MTVPNGATTGRITVRTAGGTTISATDFATTSYTSLEITAPVTAFEQGGPVLFNAIARLLDGSAAHVSTTSDANVATVSNGNVTGRLAGSAAITASLGAFCQRSFRFDPFWIVWI